ncbi:hypothetical protein ACFL6B_01200 [Thermodesulfobacteriota bacterium]
MDKHDDEKHDDEKHDDEKVLEKVDPGKRAFLKKIAVGTAFAIPVMKSFSMEDFKPEVSKTFAY